VRQAAQTQYQSVFRPTLTQQPLHSSRAHGFNQTPLMRFSIHHLINLHSHLAVINGEHG